jgi:hypothetical protein
MESLEPIVEVAHSMSGGAAADAVDRAISKHGKPKTITVDHGTEFTSRGCRSRLRLSLGNLDFSFRGAGDIVPGAGRNTPRRDEASRHQLVRQSARGATPHRRLASALQRAPATQLARLPDTGGLRTAIPRRCLSRAVKRNTHPADGGKSGRRSVGLRVVKEAQQASLEIDLPLLNSFAEHAFNCNIREFIRRQRGAPTERRAVHRNALTTSTAAAIATTSSSSAAGRSLPNLCASAARAA